MSVARIQVIPSRTLWRAGMHFVAGVVREFDLLDLTAPQLVRLAGEPAFTVNGRGSEDVAWAPLPMPSDADLPAHEADLALALEGLLADRLRIEGTRPDDDIDGAVVSDPIEPVAALLDVAAAEPAAAATTDVPAKVTKAK